jgi:hypothetical protein
MNLNEAQKQRAVELLEIIVSSDFTIEGDQAMYAAINEASRLFGVSELAPPVVATRRRKRKPTYWERRAEMDRAALEQFDA